MKKLFLTLLILNSLACFAFANLQSDATFEIRTSGDDTNGGCYDAGGSGTDYSQQDSAQLSLTDLAMTTGGMTLTSSTGGFTSEMVDNCINISSGTNFNAGFYEITGYTDTNTVTLDRDATDGTNGSGGSGKVGGAIANPIMFHEDLGIEDNNIGWVEAGTYTLQSGESYIYEPGANTFLFGYNTTRGDTPTGTNRPYFDAASATYGVYKNKNGGTISNIRIAKATSHGIFNDLYGSNFTLFNVRLTNNGGRGYYADASLGLTAYFVEADNNSDDGMGSAYALGAMKFCYSHDNTNEGFDGNNANNGATFEFSIADSNSGGGFFNNGDKHVVNCIAYNNGSHGFDGDQYTRYNVYLNNSSVSNGGYGFVVSGQSKIFDFNHTYDNTSGAYSGTTGGYNAVTGDPLFTNAASGNFELSSSSSPLIGAGVSMTDMFSSLGGTLDFNIGIDQDDHASGGGGGTTSYGFSN